MSMPAAKEQDPEDGPDIIIDLPHQNCSHAIPRSVSFFSLKEKSIIATKHHWVGQAPHMGIYYRSYGHFVFSWES
jgi:hypothetical protein